MSTLAELFDAIPAQAWQQSRAQPQPADPATDVAGDAAGALAHAARLLEHLGTAPLGRGRYATERARATTTLAEECRAAAGAMATGVGSAGRLCQLMAAAADQAAVQRPRPNSDERWAITAAALSPIQACAAVVREHAPSPGLIRLAQQIHRVSEHATALPATPAASARLDQVLPGRTRPTAGRWTARCTPSMRSATRPPPRTSPPTTPGTSRSRPCTSPSTPPTSSSCSPRPLRLSLQLKTHAQRVTRW